jgi:hypothetical protein
MKRNKIILIVTLTAYVILPFIMGAFDIGSRRGPVFYPAEFHSTLFIIACESFQGYKPREGVVQSLYDRALFYGLPERPKSKSERDAVVTRAQTNYKPDSPYRILIENENQKINTE